MLTPSARALPGAFLRTPSRWRQALGWGSVVVASPLVAWGVAHGLGWPLRAQGWLLAWALVGSPVVEEGVYRALLQEGLMRRLHGPDGRHMAHLINAGVACVVVAVHAPGHGAWALAWAVPAVVLGELYRQCRQAGWCMALHAWFNLSLWIFSAKYGFTA